ncbi:hypothetical protein BT93_L0245 [Corymbia citriodora subsp. variegata]|uniref:Uncharacterized protein n=1 Tax=Corymbia citriodora subsp. variegata TaxID=360336 RepID=A0A8T0CQG5_CORYI|nr:hypothetical protein BT93_L0245 [Corymbia citriodora subsp. variegata]
MTKEEENAVEDEEGENWKSMSSKFKHNRSNGEDCSYSRYWDLLM